MVRNNDEFARGIAPDQRVLACLAGQIGGLKFFLAHVGGVEICTQGFGSNSGDERFVVVHPVPGTIVLVREQPRFCNTDSCQPGLVIIAIGLAPEQVVHYLRRFHEQRDHRALILRVITEVGRQRELRIDLRPGLTRFRRRYRDFRWAACVASCQRKRGQARQRGVHRIFCNHLKYP